MLTTESLALQGGDEIERFISVFVYMFVGVCLVRLKCPSCGHVWDYKGKRKYYANCPNCHRSVNIAKYRVE